MGFIRMYGSTSHFSDSLVFWQATYFYIRVSGIVIGYKNATPGEVLFRSQSEYQRMWETT